VPSSNAYGSLVYKNEKNERNSSQQNTASALSPQADYLTDNSTALLDNDYTESPERVTGMPNPSLYDQYYINKYSFPKGLCAIRKDQDKPKYRKSLYDIKTPNLRKGVSGWKLTRRPHEWVQPTPDSS
jgi:hypothetical protein